MKIGDLIYCGENKFAKIVEKFEKEAEVYDIKLNYGKHIIATGEHRFSTSNGLKTVEGLKVGEELLNAKNNFYTGNVNKIDIVKMILEKGLGVYFYLSDCPGLDKVCKENNIFRNSKKTVKIELIKDHLSEIDYSKAYISKERSQYRFNTLYDVTENFMILLGHYIGNGSLRRYVVSNSQKNMVHAIESGLKETFPNFTYTKHEINNTCVIELNSKLAHGMLFDKIFECRTSFEEKQLPNFLFSVSRKNKLAFLRGYFCDGNIKINTREA